MLELNIAEERWLNPLMSNTDQSSNSKVLVNDLLSGLSSHEKEVKKTAVM